MEEDIKIKELFISSLLNELNEEDEQFVLLILESDPKYLQLYEELSSTLGLTTYKVNKEKINTSREWRRLKKEIFVAQTDDITAGKPMVTDEVIPPLRGEKKRDKSTSRMMLSTVIAGCVLLIMLIGLNYRKPERSKTAFISISQRKHPQPVQFAVIREVNVSGKTRQINLKDGTAIMLSNNSEIIIEHSFESSRRVVTLKGKATFKVAKDKTRPFTVITGDIETTVLGTTFTIYAFNHTDNIKVRLYEGSVVVTSTESAVKKLARMFYLLPGQELIYKVSDAKVTVGLIRKKKSASHAVPDEYLVTENPSIPRADKGSWYMFNNQPVADVFDQLAKMYQSEIIYKKKDVAKIHFIGKFNKTDSLETILKEITMVSNFQLSKKDNKFIITK